MKHKILLAAPETGKLPILKKNLLENNYKVLSCAAENSVIQESAVLLKPDAIILYESEPDDELLITIRLIQASTPTPMIVFADKCRENLIAEAIEAGASSFVVDSMESHRLRPIIEAGTARFRKCQTMKDKLTKTEQKLKERRDIERAKGILMKNKKLTEDEAYKLLRNMAMNKNQRIGKVASSLIQAAELLD